MSTKSFCFEVESSSGSGVDFLFSLHDKSVLDKFADEDSGVSLTDLLNFVRVNPDSFETALKNL